MAVLVAILELEDVHFTKVSKITLSTPNLGTTTSGNPLICDLEDYPTMSIECVFLRFLYIYPAIIGP